MISTTVMARQYNIRAELIRWGCSMAAMSTVCPGHKQTSVMTIRQRNGRPDELFEDILYGVQSLAVHLDHVVQVGSRG
jgi:hypothetical protein